MKNIGIVILNYNTWEESISCIRSINKYTTTNTQYTIFLIDNDSSLKATDQQINDIKECGAKIIFNKENKGYSSGNNVGIRLAIDCGCEYIMICNSDILFVDNSINKLVNMIDNGKDIGIVGPQIYNKNGNFEPFHMACKLTALGKIQNMLLKTKLSFLAKRFKAKFYIENEISHPVKVFGVIGCCFLMSRECAIYLYPLDENVFLYEEEYIIASRLENSVFSVYIVPNTHVIHFHGKSTKYMSDFSYKCFIESEQYYLKEYLKSNYIMRKFILYLRKFAPKVFYR